MYSLVYVFCGRRGHQYDGQLGYYLYRLKPRSERPHVNQIIENLRPQLAQVTGIRAFMQVPPSIRIGGQLTKSPYQYTLRSADMDELYRWAPKVEDRMRRLKDLPMLTAIYS